MRKELVIGLAIVLGCSNAFASNDSSNQSGSSGDSASTSGGSSNMSQYDENNDQQISTDEYYDAVGDVGIFSEYDSDGNGLLDENEFSETGIDAEYGYWDFDDNDALDSGEFYDGTYHYYDENEDGHWDQNEWDNAGEAAWLDW